MAERYSRLFTLPQNLYNEGSPLLIAAGALLKDNVTGAVFAQLKLKSLSEKAIKAVTVGVVPLDTAGRELSEAIVYSYLDLNVQRNADFGQKKTISLPDSTARSFKAYVSEVIFDDNSIYSSPECDWTPLDITQVELETELDNEEEKRRKEAAIAAKKRNKIMLIATAAACACIAVAILITKVIIPSNKYNNAVALMNNGNYEEALATFESIGEKGYKDSKEQITECTYQNALVLMNESKYEEAITIFDTLTGYKDSTDQITECNYLNAVVMMNNGNYEDAITIFDALNGYKDSTDQITECNYLNAVVMMNNGNYEEAIVAFDALNGYKDSTDQITECNYLKAVALMNSGNYEEAIVVFDALNEYKDSVGQILNCEDIILKNAEVGDYVWFGSYEQDNDTSNGKEGIEWLVLDKQDSKVLLLSHYGLDTQPYNRDWVDTTWENCTLRTWLNETFINNAFSSAEQQNILLTDVDNSRSQCYSEFDITGGNNTQDKIFLLSYAEANKYLDVTYDNDNNTKSRVAPTDYAIAQGAWQYRSDDCKTEDGLYAGWWWLRSPGDIQFTAAHVGSGGFLSYNIVNDFLDCVRPALWINLDS